MTWDSDPMLKSLLKGFGQSMAVVATISVLTAGAAVAADSPFKNLAGRWVGGGSIKFKTGEAEKINCRVTYFVSNGGNSVSQNIRCASAAPHRFITLLVHGRRWISRDQCMSVWACEKKTSRNVE